MLAVPCSWRSLGLYAVHLLEPRERGWESWDFLITSLPDALTLPALDGLYIKATTLPVSSGAQKYTSQSPEMLETAFTQHNEAIHLNNTLELFAPAQRMKMSPSGICFASSSVVTKTE